MADVESHYGDTGKKQAPRPTPTVPIQGSDDDKSDKISHQRLRSMSLTVGLAFTVKWQ